MAVPAVMLVAAPLWGLVFIRVDTLPTTVPVAAGLAAGLPAAFTHAAPLQGQCPRDRWGVTGAADGCGLPR